MINLEVLLKSKLINNSEFAERLYPKNSRQSAKKKFFLKANNIYRGKGFTDEEKKEITGIWFEFVNSVLV